MSSLKFYTSYFPMVRHLRELDILPVAICAKCPDGYNGYHYKKLAPSWSIFKQWRDVHDEIVYTKRFNIEVLSDLQFVDVLQTLTDFATRESATGIAMLCYEKPGDFCHRHLVADWFVMNGVGCEEIIFR